MALMRFRLNVFVVKPRVKAAYDNGTKRNSYGRLLPAAGGFAYFIKNRKGKLK